MLQQPNELQEAKNEFIRTITSLQIPIASQDRLRAGFNHICSMYEQFDIIKLNIAISARIMRINDLQQSDVMQAHQNLQNEIALIQSMIKTLQNNIDECNVVIYHSDKPDWIKAGRADVVNKHLKPKVAMSEAQLAIATKNLSDFESSMTNYQQVNAEIEQRKTEITTLNQMILKASQLSPTCATPHSTNSHGLFSQGPGSSGDNPCFHTAAPGANPFHS